MYHFNKQFKQNNLFYVMLYANIFNFTKDIWVNFFIDKLKVYNKLHKDKLLNVDFRHNVIIQFCPVCASIWFPWSRLSCLLLLFGNFKNDSRCFFTKKNNNEKSKRTPWSPQSSLTKKWFILRYKIKKCIFN